MEPIPKMDDANFYCGWCGNGEEEESRRGVGYSSSGEEKGFMKSMKRKRKTEEKGMNSEEFSATSFGIFF